MMIYFKLKLLCEFSKNDLQISFIEINDSRKSSKFSSYIELDCDSPRYMTPLLHLVTFGVKCVLLPC